MIALHKSFRSQDNLIASLYNPTIADVATQSAKQFTAEEVFQGGANLLKTAIADQAKYGVLITERKQVLVESGISDTAEMGENKSDTKTKTKNVYVWKAVPKTDTDGNFLRSDNPFSKYGVIVSQTNLAELHPEEKLNELLTDKKLLVAKKITSIQKQENAKADIETAKLEGEAKRVEAEQERLITADAEIIEKKKDVQLAEQQALREIVEKQKEADLAIIDKGKELQIAKANEGIQTANAVAAKQEAIAIEVKGLAEAKVKKAKYAAVRKDILELEVNKVTQLANAKAYEVQGMKMPNNVMITNGGKDGTTDTKISDLASMAIIKAQGKLK